MSLDIYNIYYFDELFKKYGRNFFYKFILKKVSKKDFLIFLESDNFKKDA